LREAKRMASRTLTIEVGNEFIKVVELQKQKGTVMVHHAVSVQTPPDSVEDGFVRNVSQVAEAIRNAMAEEQISAKEVTFVLSSSRVATKEVPLPLVKKDKIQELVDLNASDYFPVNIDDYVLSYTVLEEIKTKEDQKLRILVYAAPELMIQSYFDLAGVLGMKVKAVDYAGNSTLQLIKIQIDQKPTLVIQLGMDTTIASVMNGTVLQLQRTIPYGESLLLNNVMESKNVTSRVALELLASTQLVKDSLDKDETTNSLKYLISNVNRVIEYYSGRNANAPIQKVVIIGDGADVLGIDLLFANETSIPTERLTELRNIESYNRIKLSTSNLKQYMANIGSALDPIHLQPKSMDKSKKGSSDSANFNMIPYIATFAVLAVAAAGVALVPIMRYGSKESERDELQAQVKQLEPIEQVYADRDASNAELTDAQTFAATTMNNTEYAPELIQFFEDKFPADGGFTSLSISNGLVTVSGVTMQEYEVAGFLKDLEDEKHIYNVVTSGYTKDYEKQGRVSFDVTFYVVTDQFIESLGQDADVLAALTGEGAQ